MIIQSGRDDAETLADAFNSAWISYIVGSYIRRDGAPPDREAIVQAFQGHWKGYAGLYHACAEAHDDKARFDAGMQLAWEIFSNCSGKTHPERSESFVTMATTVGLFIKVGMLTVRRTREWVESREEGA